jgi:hypothetical protein
MEDGMKKKRGPGYGSVAIFLTITDVTILVGLLCNGVTMQQIGSFLFVIGMILSFCLLMF